MKAATYERLMMLGRSSGCHQRPERSFFIHGKQFPICARCTGVLIGNLTAYIMFFLYPVPLELCIAGCGVMFADWLVQYIGALPSTNRRRLLTGVIGGYALATIYCTIIKNMVESVVNLFSSF